MNTGQTMLTIAALTMLSVITMIYFRTLGNTEQTLSNISAGFTATTVATSFLERVENCQFDALSDTITSHTFKDSTRFVAWDLLGKDGTESVQHYEDYDDIDDFKGDTIAYVPGWMNEQYKVLFDVYYVNSWNGDVDTRVKKQTFLKRVDVKVWRSYPPPKDSSDIIDTVSMCALHGYFCINAI